MIWRTKKSGYPQGQENAEAPILLEILPDQKIVQASQGQSILETLLENHIEIDHSCGGMGSCGTCRVFVQAGLEQFSPRNELEQAIAEDRGFAENERLSCQNLVKPGLVIRKPY
jgi:2Fe-2S ferredoxin